MSRYFLESSAYAKLFIAEQGSTELIALLQDVEDCDKLLSSLATLEVRSAIRRRQRRNEISSTNAELALQIMAQESRRLVEQPVTATVIASACILLDRHPLRALDALQLATCIVASEMMKEGKMCFISADDILLGAASAEGFDVLNPKKM